MIKKILGLLIFGLCFVGITFGYNCTNDNFPSDLGGDYCYNIGDYNYNSTIKDNKFNFYNINLDGKLFTYNTYGIVWWENDGLHLTKQNYNSSNKINGTIDGFFICENYLPSTSVNLSDDINCIYHSGFNDFGQYIGTQNKYFFGRNTSSSYFIFRLCLYTDNYNSTFVCVEYNNYNGNTNSKFTQLGTTFLTTSTVMETAVDNPFISSGGGGSGTGDIEYGTGATIIGSEESAIKYFEENYGRDKNICYVGLDNVTTLYGSGGVSFQAGTGLTIFETFNAVYGNSDLNKVYVWLNSRLINYEQWFYRNGDPLYLANYNSGTNQVDIYYDNLIFPFSGKPVAYYFMADNIEGYYEPQGSEIVSYCNLKINNGTYDEIIDQATKNNIDKYSERSNINIGLNPDGSKKDTPNFGMFTGSAWVGSGVDIEFTGSTTLKNTLQNFFNQVDNLFGYSVSSSVSKTRGLRSQNSIIPGYIVTALMFVILFKFLRRR